MDKFVNEVVTKLSDRLSADDLDAVRQTLYNVMSSYEITEKCTKLATQTDVLLKEVKEYIVIKKIEGLSDTSLRQYMHALQRFFDRVRKPIDEVRTDDVRLYLYELSQRSGTSQIAIENQRRYIGAFFKWLSLNDYIEKDPTALIAPIKYEKKIREPLTDTELESLRSACKTSKERAIIETLYSTGCRASELTGIKLSDINFDTREVHLFGKGKKHRIAFLNAKAILSIKTMLMERDFESDHVFVSDRSPHDRLSVRRIEKIVVSLGERAGIKGRVFPHRIRHTTATDALRRGMGISEVQLLLGHEKIETTLIYAKTNITDVKKHHEQYIL